MSPLVNHTGDDYFCVDLIHVDAMRPIFLVLALLLSNPVPVFGQSAEGQMSIGKDIPVEEWATMTAGRTVTYRIDGEYWAMERYQPRGNRVTLQFYDGTCIEGTWEYSAPNYCFNWQGVGTSCFRHTRADDKIMIVETESGVATGAIQMMTGVSDTPLVCGADLTS